MNDPMQPILLAGISVRMLAELAVRAGYEVRALDYFGDVDLLRLCPSLSLRRDYGSGYTPTALVDAASDINAPSVVYGASLENHPHEVARLAQNRRLLGNAPATLEQVRDPLRLGDALRSAGCRFPMTIESRSGINPDPHQRWLWKPLRSGGGHAVRVWRGEPVPEDGVWQADMPGLVGSAAFVADGASAVLLGVTEQLIGQPVFGASGFRYCGNLLPPRLPQSDLLALINQVRAIVAHLAATFGLRGLNGLDFIWYDHEVWPIEVNPRPVASLELIDRAYDLRVFDAHVRSFNGELPSFDLEQQLIAAPAAGKAILYAPCDLTVGDTDAWTVVGLRDIPHPGEQIKRGQPVCTLLTTGDTRDDCWHELRLRAAELNAVFRAAGA